LVMLESHLGKPEKMIWWNQLPKVIFRGRAIPACPKPEIGFAGTEKSRTLVGQSHLRNP
jgi:hypothetical protein